MTVLDRIGGLGCQLPRPWELPPGVRRAFEIVRIHRGIAYLAGHGPVDGGEIRMQGRIGQDLDVQDGYDSARLTALAIIASLQRAVGDLDSLTWLSARVFVNATPEVGAAELTRIADGFSDVVNTAFGEQGRHSRAAVGASTLAFNVPTIIEAAVAVS